VSDDSVLIPKKAPFYVIVTKQFETNRLSGGHKSKRIFAGLPTEVAGGESN